jgi:hypothetical protein
MAMPLFFINHFSRNSLLEWFAATWKSWEMRRDALSKHRERTKLATVGSMKTMNGAPSKTACLQGVQGGANRENARKAGLKGDFVACLSNVLRKPPCHRAKYLQQSAPVLQTLGT